MLTSNFIGRLVDTDQRVRMLSIRGLGNMASAGPDQVSYKLYLHCINQSDSGHVQLLSNEVPKM